MADTERVRIFFVLKACVSVADMASKHERRPSKHTKTKDRPGWLQMCGWRFRAKFPHNFYKNAKNKIYLFKIVQKLKL